MESADSETSSIDHEQRYGRDEASTGHSPIVVPPYWQIHQRDFSTQSYSSLGCTRPTPITLEDHTLEGSEQNKALWAKHVTIDNYVIVSGNAPGVGAYVVWNCTVETLDVSALLIDERWIPFQLPKPRSRAEPQCFREDP